jgi:hypothetical protein
VQSARLTRFSVDFGTKRKRPELVGPFDTLLPDQILVENEQKNKHISVVVFHLLQGSCAKPTDQPLQQPSPLFLVCVRTSQEKSFTDSGDALPFALRDCLKLLL